MITPSQIPNPYVKPRWQAPVGVMESVVAYNCRKHGFPVPVGAWPMWEGAGNRAIDYSGHGNHGTLTGQPDWVADWLDFDGATDYIDCGQDTSIDITGSLTLSTWVKPASLSGYPTIIGMWSGQYKLSASLNGNGYPYIDVAGGGNNDNYRNSNIQINTTQYHHIVGVYNSGLQTLDIYTNGVLSNGSLIGTVPSSLYNTDKNLLIGQQYGGANKFSGLINNPLIFNTTLSAAQIKFLYDNPYFMYRLPEELYGYTTGAPPAVSIPVFMHHYNQLRGA